MWSGFCIFKRVVKEKGDDVTQTDLVSGHMARAHLDLSELSGQSLKIYYWPLYRKSLQSAGVGHPAVSLSPLLCCVASCLVHTLSELPRKGQFSCSREPRSRSSQEHCHLSRGSAPKDLSLENVSPSFPPPC